MKDGRSMTEQAKHIYLNGIVQGVGFRPFVFKLAEQMQVKGWVNNSSHGVNIHAEGENLDLFYHRLINEAPPLSKIVTARCELTEHLHYSSFEIIQSEADQNANVLISPDVATCTDCLQDMADPKNRRYQYPFTNCTNCGPRYTIIRDVPYDRAQTTMSDFPMCTPCAEEYTDPRDRRFHAQPVACEDCGPKVELLDAKGHHVPGIGIEQLSHGAIVAVKGLGGFHLVCDARNDQAVRRLRELKERGAKPFALMARSIERARHEVVISAQEEKLLRSPAAPIVILERRAKIDNPLAEEIAPGIHSIGMMLPYTPLHHLLFEGSYDFLVMTSANLSGRPLIYTNDEAFDGLQGIADYFLLHNRDIYHPCDDSVVQVIDEAPVFFRRARGYVPIPLLSSSYDIKQPMLAVGGELKNAFCLADGQRLFVSQYIGDMEGYENFQRFLQELESFQRVVNICPRAIVYDQHPNYQTTRFALEQALPKFAVQHHHAHLVSVLGENERSEATLGIICDGTGYGEDQCIWGFEFLFGNAKGYERLGHLEYLPLPGGDAGAKHPLRIAYAYLKTLFTDEEWDACAPLWSGLSIDEQRILDRQLEKGFHLFQTSSAGRLFDAVSALLGICTTVTYEGQAAVELESAAARFLRQGQDSDHLMTNVLLDSYPYEVRNKNGMVILGVKPLFAALVNDLLCGVKREEIAYRFHITLAQAMVEIIMILRRDAGPTVLSGGVFQNKLLTEAVLQHCYEKEIKVLRSKMFPPGDGGLALGQIIIANEVL